LLNILYQIQGHSKPPHPLPDRDLADADWRDPRRVGHSSGAPPQLLVASTPFQLPSLRYIRADAMSSQISCQICDPKGPDRGCVTQRQAVTGSHWRCWRNECVPRWLANVRRWGAGL